MMNTCDNCAKKYNEAFSFCPYCGYPISKHKDLKANAALSMFEEAHLRLNSSQIMLLKTFPFDWEPRILDKLLGGMGRNYKEINLCRLELHVSNPLEGDLIAYQSEHFMAYYMSDIEFPIPVKNMLIFQEKGQDWLDKFFLERKRAWNSLSTYLIREQWRAITEPAVRQIPPFQLSYDWNRKETSLYDDGALILHKWKSMSAVQSISHDYRYQRPIR